MIAILSISKDSGDGFRDVGTEGRSVVKNATRRKLVNRAALLQGAWQGRAVRVEEYDGSLYAESPSRVWLYHCACDLDAPCAFHAVIGGR